MIVRGTALDVSAGRFLISRDRCPRPIFATGLRPPPPPRVPRYSSHSPAVEGAQVGNARSRDQDERAGQRSLQRSGTFKPFLWEKAVSIYPGSRWHNFPLAPPESHPPPLFPPPPGPTAPIAGDPANPRGGTIHEPARCVHRGLKSPKPPDSSCPASLCQTHGHRPLVSRVRPAAATPPLASRALAVPGKPPGQPAPRARPPACFGRSFHGAEVRSGVRNPACLVRPGRSRSSRRNWAGSPERQV